MVQIHVSNEVSISITLSQLEEDLEYKCELCNFSTIFRSSLKWHIMGDHQREDDFTCITLENIEQTLTGDMEEGQNGLNKLNESLYQGMNLEEKMIWLLWFDLNRNNDSNEFFMCTELCNLVANGTFFFQNGDVALFLSHSLSCDFEQRSEWDFYVRWVMKFNNE